jgi:hypothetical protein
MSKLVVAVEPFGYYDLDAGDFIRESEYVSLLLVSGEGEIPEVDYPDVKAIVYRVRGLDPLDEEIDDVETSMSEWISATTEWYTERGFEVETLPPIAIVSPM